MNRPGRFLNAPITFLVAVFIAGGMFMVAVTQGLAMASAFVFLASALLWSFNSDAGGIYCLILAALFEGIYKAMSPNMLTMLVKDFFLGILLLRLFWVSQRQRDFRWLHQPFTSAAVCFTAYCVALMFSPTTRSILLALAGLRAWILWMPAYFPFYHYFTSLERISRFVRVLILIMLPVSVYGIIQGNIGYAHTRILPNFYAQAQFYQSDYTPEVVQSEDEANAGFEASFKPIMNVRACSIHLSPGTFGAVCAFLMLVSLGYAGYVRSSSGRVWAVASGVAAAGGLLASGSRAPMMGLAFGLLAMLLVARRRTILIAGFIIIALVSVFYLRDVTGGGALRLENRLSVPIAMERALMPMARGLEEGIRHPFGLGIATGTGMGRVFYKSDLKQAEGTQWVENEFGRALTELGFVGASLWLLMIVGILWQCVRAIRQLGSTREGVLAAGLFGAMMSVFAQLSVGSALYGANSGLYYWIFAAMIVRMAEHLTVAHRQGQEEEAPDLAATGSLGTAPPPTLWRQPGQRPPRPQPSLRPTGPAGPGDYRRAPGAPPGPRPGAPRE